MQLKKSSFFPEMNMVEKLVRRNRIQMKKRHLFFSRRGQLAGSFSAGQHPISTKMSTLH
jgi:hypothetical protein